MMARCTSTSDTIHVGSASLVMEDSRVFGCGGGGSGIGNQFGVRVGPGGRAKMAATGARASWWTV